jgi:hypothetical protein
LVTYSQLIREDERVNLNLKDEKKKKRKKKEKEKGIGFRQRKNILGVNLKS